MSKSANKRSAASSAGPVPAAKPSQAIAGKKTDAGSKQARVIAMLQSPAGATIAAFEPTTFTRCAPIRIIPCSDALKLSNNIMQKGLAFSRDWSGTVVIICQNVPSSYRSIAALAGLRTFTQLLVRPER